MQEELAVVPDIVSTLEELQRRDRDTSAVSAADREALLTQYPQLLMLCQSVPAQRQRSQSAARFVTALHPSDTQRREQAAARLQAAWRGKQERRRLAKLSTGVLACQRLWRRWRRRHEARQRIQETSIQVIILPFFFWQYSHAATYLLLFLSLPPADCRSAAGGLSPGLATDAGATAGGCLSHDGAGSRRIF